jgi:DNA polymerase-3 subunit epsilon
VTVRAKAALRPEWLAAVLPGVAFALVLAAAAGVLAATLDAAAFAKVRELIEPNSALVLMVWFFAALAGGVALRRAWEYFGAAPARLAEGVQVHLAAGVDGAAGTAEAAGATEAPPLKAEGAAGSRALAAAINALVAQRDALRREIGQRVAEGSREVEQERSRLAALMAELTQSVVVCSLDGRILLFNARARLQFRALAGADGLIGGAEPLGLNRSIYGVLDRALVAHALQTVQQRLARGAAHPAAQFVTATRGGQLLRVQLAPVREPAPAQAPNDPPAQEPEGAPAEAPLNGFVLMLENITREMDAERERERLLFHLTEGSRGAIGNLRAAVELLEDPELDAVTRERFLAVIRDEIAALARRLEEAAAGSGEALRSRWPLEEMLGSDFLAAAAHGIEAATACRVALTEVDTGLWLRVESYALVRSLVHLAVHLAEDYDVRRLSLRLAHEGAHAKLDLVFPVQALATEIVVGWESEPLREAGGAAGGTAISLRDVVQRHGGAFWFERDRVRQQAFFRFLLPRSADEPPLAAAALPAHESRPEFYDFNLFAAGGEARTAWAERSLPELTYTVFDTETTGLAPGDGDKIIQIGATRIVAAKLRRSERFEQLVDPERSISPASIAVHGLQPPMLAGQPRIGDVLPAFHAFAQDSVLVAHNAAFDMRFLRNEEAACGVRFEQPVLDTMLLAALVHPQQASHGLEAIAQRLGVPVLGRHTALGDAYVTAEVFLKLIPLLRERGIHTLQQALDASRETALARLKY